MSWHTVSVSGQSAVAAANNTCRWYVVVNVRICTPFDVEVSRESSTVMAKRIRNSARPCAVRARAVVNARRTSECSTVCSWLTARSGRCHVHRNAQHFLHLSAVTASRRPCLVTCSTNGSVHCPFPGKETTVNPVRLSRAPSNRTVGEETDRAVMATGHF